jgi:tetratricopeptide (TPR) repeat protein
MRVAGTLAAVLLVAAVGAAQDRSAQTLFEAGEYDKAMGVLSERQAAGGGTADDRFLAAQIQLQQNRTGEARAEYDALAAGPDPAWRLVGESGQALIAQDTGRAFELASRAAAESPNHFGAHYQRGRVALAREDWAAAAESFDRASRIDPAFAYAAYYAGFAYSKVQRADLTAEHFERFLKLAPKAPERLAVESIMRTLRGR